MDATNNVYSLLQSDDGDDGVSVNKANFEPYNQGVIMNMALKVEQSGDDYMVTFLSSRHSSDGSVEGRLKLVVSLRLRYVCPRPPRPRPLLVMPRGVVVE